MDKTVEWKIKEILKKVTPLDFQPQICACGNDSYVITHKMMYLSKFHKENTIGQDIQKETHYRICTKCGELFQPKEELKEPKDEPEAELS